ncbi:MAG: 4a-hydroxytetrahydrobiopterin dehydratase [Acidimicrobiales bacterium]
MADPLSDVEVQDRLADLDGWAVVHGKLHKQFTFSDFNAAFGFMTRLALAAEKMDHHPDWSNSWNTVTIDIVSHAAGGITEQCFALAARADAVV